MVRPSATLSANCSWLPLQARCVAQTLPWRLPKPAVPAAKSSEESWPVRPCRPVRTQVPCWMARRCGWRSRHQRPVRSRSSTASRATGSTVASSSSWKGEVPVLVTVWRSSSRPPSCSVRVDATVMPASVSAWTNDGGVRSADIRRPHSAEADGEVVAGNAVGDPVAAQARASLPARGCLRQQPGGDGGVDGGVAGRLRRGWRGREGSRPDRRPNGSPRPLRCRS